MITPREAKLQLESVTVVTSEAPLNPLSAMAEPAGNATARYGSKEAEEPGCDGKTCMFHRSPPIVVVGGIGCT